MVKIWEASTQHLYPFEAVSLAYFIRYPNPYSSHVLSTDIVNRHFDPETQTLYTSRLLLKRGIVPKVILKLLPKSLVGAIPEGDSQSYVLERSIVSVRDGVMVAESRNLDLTGISKVVERQMFWRPASDLTAYFRNSYSRLGAAGDGLATFRLTPPAYKHVAPTPGRDARQTNVSTRVEIVSPVGERRQRAALGDDAPAPSSWRAWSMASLQRTIEARVYARTESVQGNSAKGLALVLERLREGGLLGAERAMRRDGERLRAGHVLERPE